MSRSGNSLNNLLQNEFLSDDEGRPILSDQSDRPPELPVDTEPLRQTITNTSTLSRWTLTDFIGMLISLGHLVVLIKRHRTLQRVKILSAEGYRQNQNGVLHRFLILELHRHHESDAKRTMWLRLDRRMDHRVGKAKFVLASGVTPANDTVCLTALLGLYVRSSPRR